MDLTAWRMSREEEASLVAPGPSTRFARAVRARRRWPTLEFAKYFIFIEEWRCRHVLGAPSPCAHTAGTRLSPFLFVCLFIRKRWVDNCHVLPVNPTLLLLIAKRKCKWATWNGRWCSEVTLNQAARTNWLSFFLIAVGKLNRVDHVDGWIQRMRVPSQPNPPLSSHPLSLSSQGSHDKHVQDNH